MTKMENAYNENLQNPLALGKLQLKNRVVMAPLTRERGYVPDDLFVEYYKQRSSAGLIISEGILIEKQGIEWTYIPGLYTKEQVEGWKKVTEAVHSNGGLIFAQLWHQGRNGHELLNEGIPPPAPSAIRGKAGKYRTLQGEPGHSTPRAIEDPKVYVQMYKTAAQNAKLAGFDGVEFHCSSTLPNQFLESHSNHRTDNYGGSIENQARFLLEIIDALLQVYPKECIGVKVSPSGGRNDMGESTPELIYDTYAYFIRQLSQRDIGYIHFMNYLPFFDPTNRGTPIDLNKLFQLVDGPKIFLNGEVTIEDAEQMVKDGIIDAVVFGRYFISNPDLTKRIFNNLDLSPADFSTFYHNPQHPREVGYTDYSFTE